MRFLVPLFAFCSLVTARMATPHRRAVDTCANVNIALLGLVHLDLCLCLGGVDALLSGQGSLLSGGVNAKAKVQSAINASKDKRTCIYPDYAVPSCSKANLCDFKCPPGRIKANGQCVCLSGQYDCNGKCKPGPCSSQIPRPDPGCRVCNHEFKIKNKRQGHGMPNWARRSLSAAHCQAGSEMCGVYGKPDAWECLNVDEDLESCGGCVFPFFPGQTPGVDCSALPGVESVECRKGLCEVSKCAGNWTVAGDGHSCKPKNQVRSRLPLGRSPRDDEVKDNGYTGRPW